MSRRILVGAIAGALSGFALTSTAASAAPRQLLLSQSAAFSILGRSCGGIQEQVFATGFSANGFPAGDVRLQTRCGGSGRGGGYKTTTYTAWATATWDWFAETRSSALLEGVSAEDSTFSAEDAHGDRVYNAGTSAYLETGEPPVQPPSPPIGVSASVSIFEAGEAESLRMQVGWTLAAETAGLIASSTVTATPTTPGPPVLSATATGTWSSAYLAPVQPSTTYRVTVTSTDAEGTSEPSEPIDVTSPNEDGEGGGGTPTTESCQQNSGTIKLSPGLTETANVQSVTIKGQLAGCNGPAEPTGGTYVAHLATTAPVTCAILASAPGESATAPGSLSVKWSPLEAGSSHGTLQVPLTEAGGNLEGTIAGGPFEGTQAIFAGSLAESFSHGPTCGVPSARGVVKPVKAGTFATSTVEIG